MLNPIPHIDVDDKHNGNTDSPIAASIVYLKHVQCSWSFGT